MDTPSQTLAKKILVRMVDEKLLSGEASKNLLKKLADGKLRSEDWRLPFELVDDKEAQT